MILFFQEYVKIGIFFLFNFFLACFIIFLSYQFSIANPDTEKLSAYECGFDPYEDARNVFDVRFYIIAILFIIFDLEAVFFFPWATSFSYLNLAALFGMLDFILELLIGFIYVYIIGALDWK